MADGLPSGIEPEQWRRLTFHLDYATQQWLVYLNGALVNAHPGGVPAAYGFASPAPFFFRFSHAVHGGFNESYIDDISISTAPPAGLDVLP